MLAGKHRQTQPSDNCTNAKPSLAFRPKSLMAVIEAKETCNASLYTYKKNAKIQARDYYLSSVVLTNLPPASIALCIDIKIPHPLYPTHSSLA